MKLVAFIIKGLNRLVLKVLIDFFNKCRSL